MRILALDSSPFCGGAQKSFADTVHSLSEGHEVVLAAGEGMSRWHPEYRLSARHWSASPGGCLQFLADRRSFAAQYRRIAAAESPEFIYVNGLRSGMLLAGLKNLPPILLHDRDIRAPLGVRGWLGEKLRPLVAGASEEILRMWDGVCVRGRALLPPGFDLRRLGETPPARREKALVLLAADFVPWKRHGLFCGAAALLRKEGIPCTAAICGRSRGDRRYDAKTARRMEETGVERCAGEEALPWIAACKVLVACSEREPFGRTVVEGLAMRRNVVVTPTACAESLRRLPGVLVTEDSPEALAAGIRHALSLPPPEPELQGYSLESFRDRLGKLLAMAGKQTTL